MQEKCDVQQQQKNVQIKVVGTGSTICPILSSLIIHYMNLLSRAFSSYSVARGFSLQKERYKNKTLIDSIVVRRSSKSPGRKVRVGRVNVKSMFFLALLK